MVVSRYLKVNLSILSGVFMVGCESCFWEKTYSIWLYLVLYCTLLCTSFNRWVVQFARWTCSRPFFRLFSINIWFICSRCSFILDNKWLLSTFSFPHYLYGWFSIAFTFVAWYHFKWQRETFLVIQFEFGTFHLGKVSFRFPVQYWMQFNFDLQNER